MQVSNVARSSAPLSALDALRRVARDIVPVQREGSITRSHRQCQPRLSTAARSIVRPCLESSNSNCDGLVGTLFGSRQYPFIRGHAQDINHPKSCIWKQLFGIKHSVLFTTAAEAKHLTDTQFGIFSIGLPAAGS